MEIIDKLKAYMWKPDKDDEAGVVVVAENHQTAKRIGYYFWCSEYIFEGEYTDIGCRWLKCADVRGLERGAVDLHEGLKRGLYGWIEDVCPICKQDSILYFWKEKNIICCSGCGEEDLDEKD